jgi:DNA-binding winged helix-turn-helix (wHTH) protein
MVHLQPKVMGVLVCLAQQAGQPVSKEKLLQSVWPDTFVSDDVLKRSISELRRVFEDDAQESRIIQTIPKRGYRLVVPVEPVNGTQVASPIRRGRESLRDDRNKWVAAFAVGTLASLVLVVLVTAVVHRWRKQLAGQSALPRISSIAVLPLENLSADPTQEYFSDGITAGLITNTLSESDLAHLLHAVQANQEISARDRSRIEGGWDH